MTKTIIELWNGNLEPISSLDKSNPEIKQLENLIQRNWDKLEKTLGKSEAETLEKYADCINEYISLMME